MRGVLCLFFRVFLRSGEITVPFLSGYDSSTHLSYGDITFDADHNSSIAQIRIKASKKGW